MDFDDGLDDDPAVFRPPPLPDDRTWLHPSELAAIPRSPAERQPPKLWSVALVSGLTGALLAAGLVAATGALDDDAPRERVVERVVSPARRAAITRPDATSVSAIAERVLPAITQVQVDARPGPSSGSGVIFRSDGHLLTNNHVVEGARAIRVVLSNGDEVEGKLVGTDPDTDIAVVKIAGGPYATATLGSATQLEVGEAAVAIGSPLGLAGGPSVTVGVVSALGRRIDSPSNPPLLDMIQTDAPIAPGSSGGALLDSTGVVIGITTAIAVSDVGAEGLGFATPIDVARSVAEELIATGKVVHVWLGIEGRDVDGETAKKLGIDGGAIVQNVVEDSPAEGAGIEQKDVVVVVDGQPVDSMSSLIVALRGHKPGEAITVVVMRDGKRRELEVRLAERPAEL